jgi:hypothetical protein
MPALASRGILTPGPAIRNGARPEANR